MSDMVTFVLQLKDLMSGSLGKAGDTAHRVFGGIDKDVAKAKAGMETLAKPVKLGVDASGIEAAGRQVDDLGHKLKNLGNMGPKGGGMVPMGDMGRGGMGWAAMMGNLGATVLRDVAHKAYEVGQDIIHTGVEMQNTKVGLAGFVGRDKANFIVNDVMKSSAATPYTTQALLPGIRGLMATGYDYGRAKKDTWGIANAIAVTGGSNEALERVMMEMQHAAASGRVDGTVLRELMRNGIPIAPLLQQTMPELKGLSRQAARDKLEDMTLSYDKVSAALNRAGEAGGMFEHGLERLSQTIGGKWSTIMDYWKIAGSNLVESQTGNIMRIENAAIGALEKLPRLMDGWAPTIDRVFEAVGDLWPSISGFMGSLWQWMKPLGNFLLSEEFKNFGKDILDLATDITTKLQPAFEALGDWAMKVAKGGDYFIHPEKFVVDLYGKLYAQATGAYGTAAKPKDVAIFESQDYSRLLDQKGLAQIKETLKKAGDFVFDNQSQFDQWLHNNEWVSKKLRIHMEKLPYVADTKKTPGATDGSAAEGAKDNADAIVGGGRRQNIFNFNAPLYQVQHQVLNDVKELMKNVESDVAEKILRLLVSVPA